MGPKEEKKKLKIHRDWHHIFPTSRFKIKKPIKQHQTWHKLFGDLTPEEAILKVFEWADNHGQIDLSKMTLEKQECWPIVFSNRIAVNEVIALIISDWSIPELKLDFESGYRRQKTKGFVS